MSSTQSRIQKINERISSIEISDRKGLMVKLDSFHYKIDSLISNLENLKTDNKTKMEIIKKETVDLKSEAEKTKDEFLSSSKINFIEHNETLKSFQKRIEKESTKIKDIEIRASVSVEEKFGRIKENVIIHEKTRSHMLNDVLEKVEEEVERLWEDFRISDEEGTTQNHEVLARFESTREFFVNQIEQEKLGREENEKAIYDMMKEVVEKMKDELGKEHCERTKMEEVIKGILDEIMKKLRILTY